MKEQVLNPLTATLALPSDLSYSKRFGLRIRLARVALGLTQAELGERINTCQSTVAWWERGTHKPCLEDVELLAKNLGQPFEYFID